jgi:fimbrial chaperone protein
VNLLVRHSLPAFFTVGNAEDAKLSWRVKRVGTNLVVTARNDGGRRARISGLTLRDSGGRKIEFSRGLVGYVLGRSTMSFRTPLPQSTTIAGGTVTLSGKTDRGDFNATAQVDRSE